MHDGAVDHAAVDHAALLAGLPVPVLVLDPDLVVLDASGAFADLVGRAREQLVGLPAAAALGDAPGDPAELVALLRRVAGGGAAPGPRELAERPYGDRVLRPAAARVGPADGRLVLHLVDVTEERRALERLRRVEERHHFLTEHSPDLTFVVSEDRSLVHVSRAVGPTARSLFGTSAASGQRLRWGDLPEPDGRHDAEALLREACAAPAGETLARRIEVVTATGRVAQMDVRATNLLTHPAVGGVVMNVRDVTEQHDVERRLQQQALHDALTGLPNRRWFLDALEHAVGRSARSGQPLAVLLVDLDDFKVVNDSLGHPAGDRLLVELARRMARSLRPGDAVARLGGDEFVVLAEELHDPADALAVARRLEATARTPYDLGGGLDTLASLSIGVSTGRGATLEADVLLAQADTALYEAKRLGRARTEVFDPALGRQLRERVHARYELARALGTSGAVGGAGPGDPHQLRLHWQPIARTSDGALVGAEALVRWQHPVRGLLLPGAFLPLAEDAGLMPQVCDWVLEHTMAQAARWSALPRRPQVWVNLAAQQLSRRTLLPALRDAARRHGVDPRQVRLEVSERVLAVDVPAVGEQLRGAAAEGFGVALDDFGAGNTSLAWLQDLPLDALKLDRRFTARITEPATEAIARAVLGLAPALGIQCVGEGVETAEQLAVLHRLGCELVQGFHVARPQDAEAVTALLRGDGAVPGPDVAWLDRS